ncbi:hypothetical protein WG922_07950 [Ramlibacter sp. AN1015]|uniref:hypothetical protein n=1 Tax=Ramlibacter sp. AN1015 TaxID=3133428 RepID=UPI0030C18D61
MRAKDDAAPVLGVSTEAVCRRHAAALTTARQRSRGHVPTRRRRLGADHRTNTLALLACSASRAYIRALCYETYQMQANNHLYAVLRSTSLAAALGLAAATLIGCGGGGSDSATGSNAGAGSGGSESVADAGSLAAEASGWWATATKESGLQGSIFTSTKDDCRAVNKNLYALKSDVTVWGGPAGGSAAGLIPESKYYVQVTNPAGTKVLGSSLYGNGTAKTPIETNAAGEIMGCPVLTDIVWRTSAKGTKGYDDTTNNGDEYKVWVSLNADFTQKFTKTDSFKVAERDAALPPAPITGSITVRKFYDVNVNGLKDAGEEYLDGANGWLVGRTVGTSYETARTTTTFTGLPLQELSVWELAPDETNWYATNVFVNGVSGAQPVVAAASGTRIMNAIGATPAASGTTVDFANVCTGAGNSQARTIGYWMNKGLATTHANQDALRALNLRTDSGALLYAAGETLSADALKTWLQGARAKNMAYMLSAQLAAMQLNVVTEKVMPGDAIFAPSVTSNTYVSGFASVQEVIDHAVDLLQTGDATKAAPAIRQDMELVKNALDLGNNRSNFVQPTPCTRTFSNTTP